jgi:hypothetical protein
MQLQTRSIGIFAAMALLMAATRYNHFGSAVALPDASWAVFFLGGFFLAGRSWTVLLAFVALLLEAWGIDYYATQIQGVSDWCVTPAYGFLIPTYASLWLGGSWFAARKQNTWRSLGEFFGIAVLATSIAFLISNVSFYLLSGRIGDMSVVEYATSVAKYYTPYVTGSILYLAVAALLYVLLVADRKDSISVTRN